MIGLPRAVVRRLGDRRTGRNPYDGLVTTALEELAARLREFAAARDWEQFHTPKNLAMALAGEAGELLAEFQWLTPEESARVMDDAEAYRGSARKAPPLP